MYENCALKPLTPKFTETVLENFFFFVRKENWTNTTHLYLDAQSIKVEIERMQKTFAGWRNTKNAPASKR